MLNNGISASWLEGQSLNSDVGDFIDRYVCPDGELPRPLARGHLYANFSLTAIKSYDSLS